MSEHETRIPVHNAIDDRATGHVAPSGAGATQSFVPSEFS